MIGWPVRSPAQADMGPLGVLWHSTWHEVHAAIVPAPLAAIRSPEAFAQRLQAAGAHLRVAGPTGAPLGFCITSGNRIDQLYVAPDARGSGLARRLLDDGLSRLQAAGVTRAELDCAAGNLRAARFYEKAGWRRRGYEMVPVDTSQGSMDLRVITFERYLAATEPC